MKNPNLNPENHTATVLVLEAVATMMLMAGCSREVAIESASQLFAAAYRETENFKLRQQFGEAE